MQNRWLLTGRKALVTGGSKGIGEAVVKDFLSLGAEVLAVARNEEDLLKLKEATNSEQLFVFATDVSTESGRTALINKIEQVWGEPGILVNIVGTNIRKPTID